MGGDYSRIYGIYIYFNSGIPTESSLKNLSLNFNTEIGDITEFYSYSQGNYTFQEMLII